MKKLLVIAWHSILVRTSDGGFWLLAVAAPLFIAVLINLALGDIVLGRGVPEARLAVAIVNQDRGGRWGNLGRAFEQALLPGPDSPQPSARLFAVRKLDDAAQAQRMVAQGQLVAALIIPPDFSTALASEHAVIRIYIDGREEILGVAFGSAVEVLAGMISTGEIAIRLAANALLRDDPRTRARLEAGQFDEALADLAVRAAEPETNPIQITRAAPPAQGAAIRLTHYFAATLAIMLVSLFTLMTSAALYQERAHWTLQRTYLSPTPPGVILWGKTLGSGLGGLLLMAVLILGLAGVERLLGGGDGPTLDGLGLGLLALATVAAATGFGVAIAGLCQTYSQAASYGRALVILMGLVGGVFFPATLLPPPISLLSRLTFQYWAMDGYLSLARGSRLAEILPQVAVLLGLGLLGMAGGSRLLRRRVALDGR